MSGQKPRFSALVWQAALIAGAAGMAFLPLPSSTIERFYSDGMYAHVQPVLTSLSNRAAPALLDVLVVVLAGLWLIHFARDLRRGHGLLRGSGRVLWRTAVWSAALYLVFMWIWGLNYRRVPLVEKLRIRADGVTADAANAMAGAAVDQANLLYEPARSHASHVDDTGVEAALVTAFLRAVELAGGRGTTVVARPKRSLLDWYFKRAAVSGMTDPYFLETLIASDVLPFERPFVIAHEWSHLAGFADEGEANFVSWLACVRGSVADRYSGWLFLYQELLPSLDRADQMSVAARLGPGPREDLRASRERLLRNVNPRVAAAGWRIYDSYLKANRVPAGAASYAEVVRLVLGVEFRDNWTPVLR
jgi:hypothetical protein